MENPIKMDDLGVPLFLGNTHMMYLVSHKTTCLSDLQTSEFTFHPCLDVGVKRIQEIPTKARRLSHPFKGYVTSKYGTKR